MMLIKNLTPLSKRDHLPGKPLTRLVLLAVTLLVLPLAALLMQKLVFADTPFAPQSVITADANEANLVYATDVDGDGDIDVLSASHFDDKIAWYENTSGDGSFWTPHIITADANGAFSVYAADMDGDGDIDALSASRFDDKIAWYENISGDGSSWIPHTITTVAISARSVYAADMDGDGDMDALSASRGDDKIMWYENISGDGLSWIPHTITTVAISARSVYAADVDGDGDMDALSASREDDKIAWYENISGDGLSWIPHTITTVADQAYSVHAADVDGDGDIDALSASRGDNKIAWYENISGDGSFWIPHTITTTARFAYSVYAADMDGDGDMDTLSASALDNKIAWYENTLGDGSSWTPHTITTLANGSLSVFAADVDGDGDMDALSASYNDNKIAWYENTSEVGPVCTLDLALGYADGTLTMDFNLGTPVPALWGVWLVAIGQVIPVMSIPVPVIDPPTPINIPVPSFPSIGKVGVLTVLLTPEGVACADLALVDTGVPSSAVLSVEELRELLPNPVSVMPNIGK